MKVDLNSRGEPPPLPPTPPRTCAIVPTKNPLDWEAYLHKQMSNLKQFCKSKNYDVAFLRNFVLKKQRKPEKVYRPLSFMCAHNKCVFFLCETLRL